MKESCFQEAFFATFVFLLLSLVFGLSSPATGTTLTGLDEFSTLATGALDGGFYWNTLGASGAFTSQNLYVRSGDIASGGSLGPFLNSGNGPSTSISIPLVIGANTFTFFGNAVPTAIDPFRPLHALNVFLNGEDITPRISVFAPTDSPPSPPFPAFAANSSPSTLGLNFPPPVPAAGTLVFIDGTTTVTLTDYSWSQPAVFNTDQVSDFDNTPDGLNDFVGRLTLTVSGPAGGIIPEPSTLLLLGSGLAGIAAFGRKRLAKKV